MIKKILLLNFFIAFLFQQEIQAQNEIQRYRSKTNIHYWKNRKPYEGYWQQDVFYTIKANVDDKTDIVSGNEELVY